jgi:hypothetical protein
MPTTTKSYFPAPFDEMPVWLAVILLVCGGGLVAALTGGLEDGSIIS